jgi:hypothetical protein
MSGFRPRIRPLQSSGHIFSDDIIVYFPPSICISFKLLTYVNLFLLNIRKYYTLPPVTLPVLFIHSYLSTSKVYLNLADTVCYRLFMSLFFLPNKR